MYYIKKIYIFYYTVFERHINSNNAYNTYA